MNKTGKSQASLFLIELILAVLFFSLGSSICIRVFAQASLISREAADLSFASSQVSSAAAVVRNSDDPAANAARFFSGAETTPDGFCVFYDKTRTLCTEEQAVYTMTVTFSETDGMIRTHISMSGSDSEVIYELDLNYPAAVSKEAVP